MRYVAVLAAVAVCASAGCSSSRAGVDGSPTAGVPTVSVSGRPTNASPRPSRSHASTGSGTTSPHGAPHTAQGVFDSMTRKQRVGQLLMVGCPSTGVASASVTAIQQYAVGSVILDGPATEGMSAVRTVTSRLENDNPSAAKLFISTDQEGGEVQRLQGSGYSSIPSAVAQGQLAPAALQTDAKAWGSELAGSGINVDLAPVLDTVPSGGGSNPPIGDLDREYGNDPSIVTAHGVAFARGLAAAGVDATAKHFPGLGRVTGNTDLTSGVTDTVTTGTDAYLAPFQAAVQAGIPFVMVSTAIYSRIDPGVPAAFSKTIVTGLLRDKLGFRGVVITDDVGSARQVAGYSAGNRAVDFVAAGGDMVLTVDATQAAAMTQALLARANSDPAFGKLVDAAALRVLQAKQARGLLN